MNSMSLFITVFVALIVVITSTDPSRFLSVEVEWPQAEYASIPPYKLHHVHSTVKVREVKLALSHTLKESISDKFFLSLSRFSYQHVDSDLPLSQIESISPQSAIRLFALIPKNDVEHDAWEAMDQSTESDSESLESLNKQLDEFQETISQQMELISVTDDYLTTGQRDLAHFHSHSSHVRDYISKSHSTRYQKGAQIDTLHNVLYVMSFDCSLNEERAQRVSSEASVLLLELERLVTKQQDRIHTAYDLHSHIEDSDHIESQSHAQLINALVLHIDELQADDIQLTESISEIQALEVKLNGHLDDLEHAFHDWQMIRQQIDSLQGVTVKHKHRRHGKLINNKIVAKLDSPLVVSSFCNSYVPLVTPCAATPGDCDNEGTIKSILSIVTRHAVTSLFAEHNIRQFMIDLTSSTKHAVTAFTEHVLALGQCDTSKPKHHRHDHSSHSHHEERHGDAHSNDDSSAVFFNMLHKLAESSLNAADIDEWNLVWLSAFEEMQISGIIVHHSFDQLILTHVLDDDTPVHHELNESLSLQLPEANESLPLLLPEKVVAPVSTAEPVEKPSAHESATEVSKSTLQRVEIDATDSISQALVMQADTSTSGATSNPNGTCAINERSKLVSWLNRGWESCSAIPTLIMLKGQ